MDRQIGQVQMVRWQGRRLAPQTRAKSRVARLILGMAILSALSLMIGFYSGLPVPIGLMQMVFVYLVGLIAIVGAWTGAEALMRRNEGAGIIRRRR